jgi:hypothetical protein
MESPSETAARLGIPANRLENLLELPEVAELLVVAREAPDAAPESLFATLDLPVTDNHGLDLDRLEAKLARLHDLGRRNSDGAQHSVAAVRGSGFMIGRYERAVKEAEELKRVVAHVAALLGEEGDEMPAVTSVGAARKVLRGAL